MDDAVGTEAALRPDGGRRERVKREKLARIVSAATALFAERGFEATTTQAIAEQAGIGAGTLFLYVRSKDDLLVRVILDGLSQQLEQAFAAAADGPLSEQLLRLFAALNAHLEESPALTRSFLKGLLFTSDAERPAVRGLLDQFLDRLGDLAARAQHRGELAADVAPRDVAANLFALYFHVLQLRHGGHLTTADLGPRLATAVELQLRGCSPSPGAD